MSPRPLLPLLALALTACTADLRHPTLVDQPPTADAQARGRQLLANAALRYGQPTWQRYTRGPTRRPRRPLGPRRSRRGEPRPGDAVP